MAQFSVIELAELYGFHRQTVYKKIAKGELSKNSDGKIDLSEAIRVFGEPNTKKTATEEQESAVAVKEIDLLKEQLDLLKEQLRLSIEREKTAKEREEIALEREHFYQSQIETMQRLLMTPKEEMHKENIPADTPIDSTKTDGESNTEVSTKSNDVVTERSTEVKKGFWSSLFK